MIKKKIETIRDVKEAELLYFEVTKKEVINKNYKRLLESLQVLRRAGKHGKEKLMIVFEGFDDDEREIYAIPEIRAFVKEIYERYSYIFYFLTNIDNNRTIIYACLNDYESYKEEKGDKVALRIIPNATIQERITTEMLKYGISQDDLLETRRILVTFI